jgi:hypothetical protein
MTTISPAVWYGRIVGIVLTLAGIVGLAMTTSQDKVAEVAGLDVNLTHNLVHLATGLVGLYVGFMALRHARSFAIVFGVVYAALGVWGLIEGGPFDPFGIFGTIDMTDTWIHLLLGIAGIGAYVASTTRTEETVV